ncbi:hypothetical protein AYO08_10555 [Pseudomonas putida]|nr:hypothetical protein AYO08_10555 [Pseudomonas putida]OOV92689.1 hypothetical protein MF6396_25560 [Pseudomonas sp. MF6396]
MRSPIFPLERFQLATATAGKRFGIEDPVKALQEQEQRKTVLTVREALQTLQTVPDEHLDLPLVCENDTFYFDCSSTWELTTRDRRTHSWAEKNDPEPAILI